MGGVGVEELRLNFHEYLIGELWTLAVDDFIEMNCIYFEPQSCNNSDNHRAIWKSYVSLVSRQIDYFLEVFGVSGSNLKSALQTESSTAKINPDKLRQVLAGEDTSDGFNLFVNIMISKRIALDRLTAEIMAQIAESESSTDSKSTSSPAKTKSQIQVSEHQSASFVDDEEAMNAVLKQSLAEYRMTIEVTPNNNNPPTAIATTSASSSSSSSRAPPPPVTSAVATVTPVLEECSEPLHVETPPTPAMATLSLQREASTLMVHNLKKEEDKAKERLEKNPFAASSESAKPSSGREENSDFLSSQIEQAGLDSSSSVKSSGACNDGSKRFVDLRKQLLEKKSKMRDDKAEALNMPVSQRPSSARKHRTAAGTADDANNSASLQSCSGPSTEARQSEKKDPSRDKIRKNIFASVRQEIMDQ